MKRIAVFCGAAKGHDQGFEESARFLGRIIAQRNLELVYGGGRTGLMGVVADSVLDSGGRVIGVIPESLCTTELAHRGIQDLRVVSSLHERKALMSELADGFVAMPGGIGTLDEFFEIWTWAQIGLHRKPIALLNIGGYFDYLLHFLRQAAVREGFVEAKSVDHILVDSTPSAIFELLEKYREQDIRRHEISGSKEQK